MSEPTPDAARETRIAAVLTRLRSAIECESGVYVLDQCQHYDVLVEAEAALAAAQTAQQQTEQDHARLEQLLLEACGGWRTETMLKEEAEQERDRLRAALTDAGAVLREAVAAVPMMLDIMRQYGYVFERFPRNMKADPPINDGERWEALAFSLYSELGGLASKSRAVLDELAELASARQDGQTRA